AVRRDFDGEMVHLGDRLGLVSQSGRSAVAPVQRNDARYCSDRTGETTLERLVCAGQAEACLRPGFLAYHRMFHRYQACPSGGQRGVNESALTLNTGSISH